MYLVSSKKLTDILLRYPILGSIDSFYKNCANMPDFILQYSVLR
ncbi:hypothetical protein BSPLISOX_1917 [uncultured Gammaproteobacteria bacterium]|nr:hypothetical protein [uncultured Gammaproteobacteria bacterium]VVH65805.1 hypothetical protein BSPLISOX_1917 [uncultured Gammaproteobacteria bacterium]